MYALHRECKNNSNCLPEATHNTWKLSRVNSITWTCVKVTYNLLPFQMAFSIACELLCRKSCNYAGNTLHQRASSVIVTPLKAYI